MTQPQPSPDELRQQLAALERSLADLRAAGMGEAVLAPLRDQANVIRNRIVAGGDADGRDKIIQGDEVHGDKVMGDKIFAIADRSPEELLRLYLRSLADECCRLPLGVIHREFVRTGDEVPIPLPDVYVDLDVVVAPAAHKQRERTSALRLAHGEGGDRQPLLPTLARQESSRAVLLGDPGSGKTTFVNYLTYLLATGSPALPPDFAGLLPFRLVLREVASQNIPAGATRGTAQMLWEALGKDLVARLGQVAGEKLLPYLQARMADQGAFVLLDGLDEAPAARERRAVLVQSIAALAGSLGLPGGRSRILVTARPHAYTNKVWRLPGFAVFGLAPFNEGQVDRFVERWYGAARTSMKWSEATAREKAGRLNAALREREYLAALASRPLLLTLMATLHSSEGGQLPEDRADLYEETVKLLLGRWQRERELTGPDGELLVEPAIAQALGVGEERVRAALEALAFTVHDRQRTGAEREGPADIGEADLLRAFRPLLGKLGPDELLVYLRDRSGILVALGEDTYAFPHRSFQEYLAACHLARGANFAQRLRGLACSDPSWWREVCLLGAGKARQGGMGAALNLVSVFIGETVEEVGQPCAEHWRLAVLAGQALVELRVTEKVDDQPDAAVLLKRSRRWLAQLVEGGRLPPRERAEAGDVLGQLGDPRFDPKLYYLPYRYRGHPEPQHGFVEIPAGRFLMGSQRDDEGAYPDEYDADGKPTEVDIPYHYWMARYPVTVAQYGAFLEDGGGAENSPWWTEVGRRWRRGEWDSQVTEDWLKDWLKQRPVDRRGKPLRWSEQELYPNRPVMYVSWFEAVAYCRWLDARLQAGGWPPAGYEVRLPTECEWERAARGNTQRQYAWGDESWDEDRVNIESRVGRAAAVGLYPRGATPDTELHDLAGNLWEWTATLYQPYPYKDDDGRNDREAEGARVMRGGSWHSIKWDARCAARNRRVSDDFYHNFGFRVAVSRTF